MSEDTPPSRRATRTYARAALLLVLGYLIFFHLDRFPHLFYDEGSYLQLSQNLALHGLYAQSDDSGPIYYGATLAVGPTLHGPVAAAFRVFGIGVLTGRLVVTAYLVVGLFLFHRLARRLGGRRSAWAATVLLLVAPSVALVPSGRQVMGEVPAFAFLVGGLLLWFRHWGRQPAAALVGVGLLFGLAAITKNQFAIILDASLVCGLLLNALYYRLVPARVFLLPLAVTVACHLGWTALMLYLVIPAGRAEIVMKGAHVAAFSTLVLPPLRRAPEALRELLRPGAYFGLLVPALAYGIQRARARRPREQMWAAILTLILTNFAWFVLFTVAWPRYVFLGLALASLCVARLLARISGDFRLHSAAIGRGLAASLRVVVLAWMALAVGLSGARLARDIALAPPDDASAMAASLALHVPPDAVIETWEPEMSFLSDRRFHFPPSELMGEAISRVFFAGPPVYDFYDPVRSATPPDWLLVGAFAGYADGYPLAEVEMRYRPVETVGQYHLFKRVGSN